MENCITLSTKSFRLADSCIEFSDIAIVDDETEYVDGKPVEGYCCAVEMKVIPAHNFPCVTSILIPSTDMENFKKEIKKTLFSSSRRNK